MNLVDIIEMFCDWKAASERQLNGNILKSIETNQDRFGYSRDLGKIMENTASWFEEVQDGPYVLCLHAKEFG